MHYLLYICIVDRILSKKHNAMKNFWALVALVAVTLTACNKGNDEPSYSSAIKLNKTSVQFTKNGGEEVIGFTLQNPAGGKVTAEDNAEWLDAVIEMNSEVIITAEPNTGDEREAVITVKYASAKDVTITVKQKAANSSDYDAEFTAKHFEGRYYGTEFSNNYNYFVVLSDTSTNIKCEPKSNGTYYFFDFYSSVAGNEEAPILPNGTYTFDAKDTLGHLTFSDAGSWYQVQEEGKTMVALSYKSATVVVENEKFEAIIELSNGEVHRVTYEGDLTVASDNIYSTFTKDFTFAIEGANITATNYGDTQGVGMQSWFIEAVKDNDLFMLEVFSAKTDNPSGAYTALADSSNFENKFIPGMISDGMVGSWYAKLTNGTIKGDVMAPMVDGLVQVTVEGNTATINYSTYDDAGNKIEGSISGAYTTKQPEM